MIEDCMATIRHMDAFGEGRCVAQASGLFDFRPPKITQFLDHCLDPKES
jgi:hypothetical protein